jgi:hypothetical protein
LESPQQSNSWELQSSCCLTTFGLKSSPFRERKPSSISHGGDVAAGAARVQQPLLLLPLAAGALPSARQEVQEDHLRNLPAARSKAHPACYHSNFLNEFVCICGSLLIELGCWLRMENQMIEGSGSSAIMSPEIQHAYRRYQILPPPWFSYYRPILVIRIT